ncbi:MAG: HEAT repeat domain-containing protein [Deltaproteobacteria bacterium]|nr:HEAT repeat domain-containing protein [Deltaproteobacteria bacterium]
MRHEGARRIARLVCAAIALSLAAPITEARAEDRITELSKQLSSSSDKVRLSAVTALARLGDKSALKPLVTALGDPNPEVRGVAAIGLGRLGHKAALPALRTMSSEDTDAAVRASAKQAATAIARANGISEPGAATASAPPAVRAHGGTAGFGNQPRALEARPEVYVAVNNANDDSPGKTDKAARQAHAEILKTVLVEQCKLNTAVTTVAAEAKRFGLDARNIDISVIKLETTTVGAMIQMNAELRLAISDGKGRMMSFLSGGAAVQLPKAGFDTRHLPKMRRDALENALRGMFDKLIAHLRGKSTT